ncbi:MAG: ABC transporter permease [Treponema sp.]|jgi:putative ABC transport system permease protein|nr:ABC transporter permease [Treponema sp.]
MNALLLLHTCFRNIFRNRMRSLLTSLGIIIGVGSVIIMIAIGEGSQREIEARITAMGTNLIQIMPQRMFTRSGQSNSARRRQLTQSDAAKLRLETSYAAAVSGVTQRSFTVSGGAGSASVSVMGVEAGYLTTRNWKLAAGGFFDDEDGAARNRVAVLGATTVATLFGDGADAISQQFRIGAHHFTVIGVLDKKGSSSNGTDQDDVIMVPLDTALTRLTNSKSISSIAMSVISQDYMSAAQKEAELILREAHGLSGSASNDFEVMNSADMIEMASETSRSLTVLLAAIAGVSLLVGGIGIMNIMLVSVTERTREIGIRMSIGARKRDILLQFLTEATILSLLGGVLGIALAVLVCRILSAMSIATSINPLVVLIATAFAALVGVLFGYYPARKASSLYPIDALRYE